MYNLPTKECRAKAKSIRDAIAAGVIRSPEWHYIAEYWDKTAEMSWLTSPEPQESEVITMRRTGRLVVLLKQDQVMLITPERNINTLGVKNKHRVFTLTNEEFTEHNGVKIGLYLLPYGMNFLEFIQYAQPLFIDKKPAVYGRLNAAQSDLTNRETKKPSVP